MKATLLTLVLGSSLCSVAVTNGASTGGSETGLTDAISAFNMTALSDPIGETQTPLTVNEVVAEIRAWNRPDAQTSEIQLAAFKSIAETQKLPKNASFESLNGYDGGGDYVFDMWSIRIVFEGPNGSTYAFPIRRRMVASRTLSEELERVEAKVAALDPQSKRVPGWYRIENRIRKLKSRIAASMQNQ